MSLKCVILGSSGTGKSSIIRRYMTDDFNIYIGSTIGASFNSKFIEKTTGRIRVDIWDTAGQERFEAMIPLYYKGADICLIVYDITSNSSFVRAKKWVDDIKSDIDTNTNPVFVLIGNKTDLADERCVSTDDAQKFANSKNIMFYECSAKTPANISMIFDNTINMAYNYIITKPLDNNTTICLDSVDKLNNNTTCWGWVKR